jgi:hypothetical protein
MRSLLIITLLLPSCPGGMHNSQDFHNYMRVSKAIAGIHMAEAQLQSRTGRYGSLKELPVALPDEWSFALSLTPTGYGIAARPHDAHNYSFFSDQTMAIRRCAPRSAERACPVTAESPILR